MYNPSISETHTTLYKILLLLIKKVYIYKYIYLKIARKWMDLY